MELLTLEEQLAAIKRGAGDVFPEEELVEKLKRSLAEKRPLRVKLGVDPTATDLHLGHMVPLLKLKTFQDLGHQAVLIIGDYTAMLGDPSGRNKARPQLTHEQVMANCRTYEEQAFKILDRSRTEVVFNGSWFSKMEFTDVIALLSRMTLARMLEREDFANRYKNEVPIGLHELVYPLMQGYDSAMIRADVELGGMDQKFNILVGRDIQREIGQEPQVGICVPILLGTDGVEKMSKSLGNYIGIQDSPAQMYGKTMSIPDELMDMYFELLTEVPGSELEEIRTGLAAGTLHPRDVKRRLAREIVGRFHGPQAAREAEKEFDLVFVKGELPEDMPELAIGSESIWIVELLRLAGFAASNGEARRLIQGGGVRIDGEQVDDADLDWVPKDGAVLQVGKRRFIKVVLK
ncbi:MAG: tyrosine--tRNA ligase [Firmicutes bacterium]|nr:tyrosine--tRNA ligase [Bacillota bacterium]